MSSKKMNFTSVIKVELAKSRNNLLYHIHHLQLEYSLYFFLVHRTDSGEIGLTEIAYRRDTVGRGRY